ncbi:MAG: hypothetical protein JXX29_08340 [Deltaproteobacteria bacterium]|nr:hypothetical protein [Deltaproteobacteria bacterium]MBN2671669.1 hypothetical protein [Deltaproteobacteria bacterium]
MTDEKKESTEEQSENSIFDKVLKGKVRQVVNELKMPKEALNYIFKQVDETKHAAVKIIAREVRELLEKTDLAEEATKVLTSLSFEITTNVRFVPNEDGKKKRVKFKLTSKSDNAAEAAPDENSPKDVSVDSVEES